MNSTNGYSNGETKNGAPRHVAIIMDGNGRWAKSKGLMRVEGHRNGAKTVRMVVEESRKLGVRYLTLFAFSSENWNRPKSEVSALMQLFKLYIEQELPNLIQNGVRLRAIGDLSRLPKGVQESLSAAQEKSRSQSELDLVLAVSYGGRGEIVNAARNLGQKLLSGELSLDGINEQSFSGAMYAPDIPDPDLLIRTSDENRISNFLLWQLAYSEIVVSPMYWPDFDKIEYLRCLAEYKARTRRFGLTDEQLEASL